MVGAVRSGARIRNEPLRSSCGRGGRACTGTDDDDEEDEEDEEELP